MLKQGIFSTNNKYTPTAEPEQGFASFIMLHQLTMG